MKKSNRTPQRRCVGCGKSFDQDKLLRVRINDDTRRSAYICRDMKCLEIARKKRSFERSLRCAVSKDIYDTIEEELSSI